MSAITTMFPAGYPSAEATATLPPSLGFGESSPPAASDAVSFGPLGFGGPSPFDGGGFYGGSSSGSTGLGAFGSIMNGFMNILATALASLGNLFGAGSSSGIGTGTGFAAPVGEQSYANATASSVGDPHDAFAGTTAQGASVSNAWDNMQSHSDLLDSDSFGDGYRVATTTSEPNARGKTYDSSATISTNGGATAVTMNADGSYAVTENGRSVSLTNGQSVSLDATETVTLGSNGALTIGETSASGGSLTTILSSNGDGGVDVNARATNVDLGGYLARRSDVATGPIPFGPSLPAVSTSAASPVSPFGTFTTQYGSGASSFDDVSRILAQDSAVS